jgi:hypothetical protein
MAQRRGYPATLACARSTILAALVAGGLGCLAADRGYVVRGTVRCGHQDCDPRGALPGAEVELRVPGEAGAPDIVFRQGETDARGEYGYSVVMPASLGSRLVLECRKQGYQTVRVALFTDGRSNYPECGAPAFRGCWIVDVEMSKRP